ncbi:Conserved_hypothetical protein [Hexamita inflata]|uniref:Uncharacterized protein n=1 Tax=Hexamita inflata TaxID=28002 RepID=A0ABP1JTA4_9EUKA
MPRSTKDVQVILKLIAKYLSTITNFTVDQLLSDHKLLDLQVCMQLKFPWHYLGSQLDMTTQQIYRWYFDTFQRNLYGHMDEADMKILKQQISIAQELGVDMDLKFQTNLKSQLSKQYQRNVFTVAFNNTKRTLLKKKALKVSKNQVLMNFAENIVQNNFVDLIRKLQYQ